MKTPGPDHPITLTPTGRKVRVSAHGTVIADSTEALTLQEATYPAEQYIPRNDATMALLKRSDRTSHCPYKGDASYFDIVTPSGTLPAAVWSYEAPYPAMREIAGHLAFYPDKVTIEIDA